MFIIDIVLFTLTYSVHYSFTELLMVNSHVAPKGSFRYSAALSAYCPKQEATAWVCGASVVKQRVLLSAAHCVDPCKKIIALIHIGDVDRSKARPIKFSHHKTYDTFMKSSFRHDISILFTKEDIDYKWKVNRVALLKNPPRGEALVAGWGRRYDLTPGAEICLRYAKQKILDKQTCKELIGRIPKGTICARPYEKKNRTGHPSKGDSGSALVVRHYIQVGIVSYMRPFDVRTVVYTHVPHYLNWIKKNTRSFYCGD